MNYIKSAYSFNMLDMSNMAYATWHPHSLKTHGAKLRNNINIA